MKLLSTDFLNFNVDHIELFWTLKNADSIVLGLDDDNSNFREYKWFTLEKTEKIKNYRYKIAFWKNNIPVFAWYLWEQLNIYIETRDYFTVYGSAFNFMSLSEILEFINENISLDYKDSMIGRHTLKRIDLALDIKKDINELVVYFKSLKQKWAKFFGDKWELQTYYIWEKKNRLNKALLIRLYDKLADIKQKEKQRYFSDYLRYDGVTRIEIEFRQDLLAEVKLKQFLDRSFSFGLFCLYIWKHTDLFKSFQEDDIKKLQRKVKSVNLEDIRHRQKVRKRYVSTFLWYAKTFLWLSSCPIDILIREWIYNKKTLYDICIASTSGEFDKDFYCKWLTLKNAEYIFADNSETDDDRWGD